MNFAIKSDCIFSNFNKINDKLFNSTRKSGFLSGLMPPMMMFVGNFGYVCVCIVGALLVINNKIINNTKIQIQETQRISRIRTKTN